MNFIAVNSLVAHKSARPACFFPSEFTKSNSTVVSSSTVIKTPSENLEGGEAKASNSSFPAISNLGFRLNGGNLTTRTVFTDKPLKPEGSHTIKLTSDDSRTFLNQYNQGRLSEEKNILNKDGSLSAGFSFELQTCWKSSLPKASKPENKNEIASITSSELVVLLANPESSLVLDCRNFMTYNVNHIKGAHNINLANKITRKRFIDGRATVVDFVSGPEGKAEYKHKESTATFVLYDDNTTNLSSLPAGHPLKLLSSRLKSEDRDVRYLEGGIHSFQKDFCHLCHHPDAPPTPPLLYSPTSQDVDIAVESATISEILPFLYVGNERDASNLQTLQELGITHILNVTGHIPFHFEDRLTCKRLEASDSGCQNLKQYFEEAIRFIESARLSNGKVLIHCQAGVSRSPTIAMAYVMARFGKSLQDVFSLFHSRRSIISPNINFLGQLLEFEQRKDLHSSCLEPFSGEFPV